MGSLPSLFICEHIYEFARGAPCSRRWRSSPCGKSGSGTLRRVESRLSGGKHGPIEREAGRLPRPAANTSPSFDLRAAFFPWPFSRSACLRNGPNRTVERPLIPRPTPFYRCRLLLRDFYSFLHDKKKPGHCLLMHSNRGNSLAHPLAFLFRAAFPSLRRKYRDACPIYTEEI